MTARRSGPEARERRRSVLVGLVVLAVGAVIGYVTFTAHTGALPGAAATVVRAEFARVGTTDTNTEVRRFAQRIGQVTAIEVRDGRAVVTMRLDGAVPVHADATAALWDQSALGQKFVELRTGTPAAGPLGDVPIPLARTEYAHDLADLLDVFDPATRAALQGAVGELGAGASGRGADVQALAAAAPGLLAGTGTVADALADPAAELPGLLAGSVRLGERFDGRTDAIRTLLRRAEQTLAAVRVDDGRPLADTLASLAPTLEEAGPALDTLPGPLADVTATMRAVGPGARALGAATPDLRGLLAEGAGPLADVPGVADAAEPALADLTDTLADLRPFVPRLGDGLAAAAPPLQVLAPYARDLGLFGDDFGRLVTNNDGFDHQFRLFLAPPGAPSAAGLGTAPTNVYPEPGEAIHDRDATGALIPGRGDS